MVQHIPENTKWEFGNMIQISYNEKTDTYQNARLFKQGFYNYKYVLVDKNNNIIPGGIDGNFDETENEYNVVVYYRDFGQRFDRVVGVGKGLSEFIKN